jgi:ankyrin repeat protein
LLVLFALLCSPLPRPSRGAGANASAPLSEALARTIRDGDAARLAALLDGGADANARDADRNTPLILAALYAGPDCVELLLKKGADPNAANAAGATALVRAATDADKARLLVAAGAKVDARTALGNTPLILAARQHGNAATVRLLLERGADPRGRNAGGAGPIVAAAASGDVESARLLLDHGADPNDYPEPGAVPGDPFRPGGRTALMWAAYRNDLPMLRLLLERGADPNKSTPFGSPLSHACWHDSTEAARLLLERGARADARDPIADFTPLHWAASSESPKPDLVNLLLAHGADPNAAGGDPIDAFMAVPQTPLMLAARRGDTPIVRALLAAGATGAPATPPAVSRPRALPERIDAALLRGAAERAIVPLQVTAKESTTSFVRQSHKQDCVSCHQQYLPMAAVGHARARSLRLDDPAAREQVRLIERIARQSTNIYDRREYVLEALFHPDGVFTRGYGLFGLASEKVAPGQVTDGMVHFLATVQAPDGRWMINIPRPPIQSGDVAATALAIQGLKTYGWPGRKAEFEARIDRARRWLWSAKPESNEEAVYQLLGLHWAGEPAAKLDGLATALAGRQREDGGWSQLPTLASDAYATGQALYALARAAGPPAAAPAKQRGLRFLLSTQRDDGTWHATRRAFPFQPTMPSGFPHGRDAWLSAAATSWAVIALTQAIDPAVAAAATATPSAPAVDATPAPAPAAADATALTVDFVNDIKPVLERSCVACHGATRARSHYRVDSRDALLKGGDTGEAAVIPGHSDRSPLVTYVTGAGGDLEMPPPGKRHAFQPLNAREVQLLRAWIDQDAAWPAGAALRTPKN